jgi:hypothetical protein
MKVSRTIQAMISLMILFAVALLGANPQVSFINLMHGSRIPDCENFIIQLNPTAENSEIKRVYAYSNMGSIGSVRDAPWELEWKNLVEGYYTLWAKVTDQEDNEAFSDTIGVVVGNVTEGNRIYNGTFNCSTTRWSMQWNSGSSGTMTWIPEAGISEGGAVLIEITNPGTADWHIQFDQAFPIDSGKTYQAYFIADSPQEKVIKWVFQEGSGDYTTHKEDQVTVNGNALYGPLEFIAPVTDKNCQFKLYVGNNTVPIYFDDIMVLDATYTLPADPSAVEEKIPVNPTRFAMIGNFPNPFNSTTVIQYSIPAAGDVLLEILNVRGERVDVLVDSHREPGMYKVLWNGISLSGAAQSSGTYIARLKINNRDKSQTLVTRLLLLE